VFAVGAPQLLREGVRGHEGGSVGVEIGVRHAVKARTMASFTVSGPCAPLVRCAKGDVAR